LKAYAKIYLNLPIDKHFTYLVPERYLQKVKEFQRVEVTFNSRKEVGFISKISEKADITASENTEFKEFNRLIDKEPVLNHEQLELAQKMADFYLCSTGEAIFCMLPAGRRETQKSFDTFDESTEDFFEMTDAQKISLHDILNIKNNDNDPNVHLLYGVTGSGKTKVYIELIKQYIQGGMGALFLLPEIALTSQFYHKLKSIFKEQVSILHSGLSISERFNEYKRLLSGQAKIALGTRSAVFAPVNNLRFAVLDEEHDSSYKENNKAAKYHSRQIAHMRLLFSARNIKSSLPPVLLLGSATPSVETFYSAKENLIHLHRLKTRATGTAMPKTHIIQHDSSSMLISVFLKEKIQSHLKENNQIMLLLNKRGYSSLAYCKKCDDSVKCPHCSFSLSYHKKSYESDSSILKCHLCGYNEHYKHRCAQCDYELKLIGEGTQKIEDFLDKHFPNAVYARLDSDTASEKDYSADILQAMGKKEIQILIGTQMISKGFDIKGITLVGIISADHSLNLPDFRAPERIFQYITQASGRSGRHQKGEVVIQVSNKDHYAVSSAVNHDYISFFENDILFRKELSFPPFMKMLRILFVTENEKGIDKLISEIQSCINDLTDTNDLFNDRNKNDKPKQILGPVEAPIFKINSKYRVHMILLDSSYDLLKDFAMRFKISFQKKTNIQHDLKLHVDVEPLDIL